MGLFFRRIEHDPELRGRGLPGKATIRSLKLLTRGEFRLSQRKVEALMAGEGSINRARIELSIQLDDGRPAYPVRAKVDVPFLTWGKLGVDGVVPVFVDPEDPERFEIDWEGEITSPTLEQRAAGDPIVAAMLEGLDELPKQHN